METTINAVAADGLADIFKALSEPNRLRILALLREGTLCACDLEQALGLRQSNLSRHLTVLKNARLVSATKKNTFVYYHLSAEHKTGFDIAGFLGTLHGDPWDADTFSLKTFLTQKNRIC